MGTGEFLTNLLTSLICGRLTMKSQESAKVELWLLEKLDLTNVDVLKWVDATSSLLNLTPDNLRDEFGGELSKVAASSLTLNNLNHLLTNGADLGRLSVGSLLDLVWPPLSEGNGKQAEEVVVGGLDGNVGLDQRLPFSDERSELVGCEVETMEVGQAVLSLNLIYPQLDFTESVILILLQIGQRNLENTTLQGIVGVLQTSGAVDKGLSNTIPPIQSATCLLKPLPIIYHKP